MKSLKILKYEFLIMAILLLLSTIYFYKIIFNPEILVHGDNRFGLTINEHIMYHIKEIYIHAPKLPVLFILYLLKYPLGNVIAEKFFISVILFISAYMIYLSNRYFINKVFPKLSNIKLCACAFVGSLIFLYNPWTINKIHHHYWLVLSLASSYIAMTFIDKIIELKKFNFKYLKYLLILSLLITLIVTQVQSLFIYFLPFLLIYILLLLLYNKKNIYKLLSLNVLFSVVILLLLNAFWIYPYLSTIFSGISKPGSYSLVYENVMLLSRRATILHIFQATSMWIWGGTGWLSTVHYSILVNNVDLWNLISLIPVILCVFSLFLALRVKNRSQKFYVLYFSFLFIISVLLSGGAKAPLIGKLYSWIVVNFPLGWILRDPYKNVGLYIVSLSFFYSLLCAFILNKQIKRRFKIILLPLLIIVPAIWGWPALTGDLNGHLTPYLYPYPKDIENIINYFEHSSENYNTLWYPAGSPLLKYRDVPEISSSYIPIYNLVKADIEIVNLNELIYYLVKKDDITTLKSMFDKLSIHNIVLRKDYKYPKKLPNLNLLNRTFSKIFVKVNETRNFYYYINTNSDKLIRVSNFVVFSTDPNYIKNFRINGSVISYLNPLLPNVYIVSSNNTDISTKFTIILPRSKHFNPNNYWSPGSLRCVYLGTILPYLEKYHIENWQFIYGHSLVFTYAKNATLVIPFNVEKTDNYTLFIRYFKNQKGGEIKVYVDNKSIEIRTKDQLNKFIWKDLGTFYLKKGEYKLTVQNVNGFNAVNLFVLIPEKDYVKSQKDIEKLLQNKTVIYIFEAESDLYKSNSKIIKSPEASNGELIILKNGKVWQYVNIVKNGTYRIALKGIGKFKVKIGNYSFIINSNNLNFTYTPTFYLNKGKYNLTILAKKDSYLDVIWLYSTKNNETIEQLFKVKEKPAKIISYKKINPTLWEVQVNATKPFMLSFAESYDPLWEARVYKDGKLVEKVSSVSLYGVINGFYINETGNLKIIIRYKPQDWFDIGLAISGITFICCIFYLIYDWRREKGDKWAINLNKKLNNIISKIKIRK